MKSNDKTKLISQLLERWYDGSATPAEVDVLVDYFNAEDIPDELEDDARMFRMMAADGVEPSPLFDVTAQMPDLVAEINAAVKAESLESDAVDEHEVQAKRVIKPRIAWWTIGTVAAVASLAFVLMNRNAMPDAPSTGLIPEQQHIIAMADKSSATPDTIEVVPSPEPTKVEVAQIKSQAVHSKINIAKAQAPKATDEPIFSDEVTDPEEALAILMSVDRKLSAALAPGYDAMSSCVETLDNTRQLVNSKLNI